MIEEELTEDIGLTLVTSPYLTPSDITTLLTALVLITVLAWIVGRVINFIPSFIHSIMLKIENKSISNFDDVIKPSDLDTSTLGTKTFFSRWIK